MKTLRPFREGDAEQVWSLHERALAVVGAHAGHGPWDDDLRKIDEVYVRTGGCFLVVVEDEHLLAMGALKRHANGEGEVKRMRVEPAFQRQGLGQLLLDALLKDAKGKGIKRLFLDTTEQQVAAQRLYEKNGFTKFETKRWRDMTMIYYERNEPNLLAGSTPRAVH